MKRVLLAVGLIALWCFYQRRHNAKRHPAGGFRCADCGGAFADMGEAIRGEDGYVDPARRVGTR